MGFKIQIGNSGSKDCQVIVEVNGGGKKILAGAGVVLGVIALIGLLASFGLHHTALTIAQDCAKCALTGSVVFFCLAGIVFAVEKRVKRKHENKLNSSENKLDMGSLSQYNHKDVKHNGKEYTAYESKTGKKVKTNGEAFRAVLLVEKTGEYYINSSRQPVNPKESTYILKLIM